MFLLKCSLFVYSICERNVKNTLTKPEARKAYNDLNLLEGSRVEMIERISYALIDTNSGIDDGCVLYIDKENSIDDDDRN